ncbi:microtubule-associated protein tau-like [Pangasianodon hypophthalmus]|uniref:microtubule-associated protein tau-like n=1 Tax=Pangasianodon hypophthalmus TaxID=310915 RepID=UPI0023082E23|nr:microtubule-associated protein tau-like [Pangasianodon hypophthalmus]
MMNMFALVEWKEETDNESWSIVPTSHIKNFDNNDFLDGLDDTSVYLIKWRGGLKKKPKGGWPLYEATVHKIAEKQCTLEKLMRTQRQSSPKLLSKRKCRPNPKFVEEETSNDGPSSPKKRQTSDGNLDRELLEKIKLPHGPRFPSATTSVVPPSPTSPSSASPPLPNCPPTPPSAPSSPASSSSTSPPPTSPSSDPPLPDIIAQLKAENEALKMELENLKTNVVSQMPKLLSIMCKLGEWLEGKEQSPQKQLASPSTIQETLEIHPGSGVCVTKKCVLVS